MRKCLRISSYIKKPFFIYIWLCNCSTLNFLIYEENLIFFFISVPSLSMYTWKHTSGYVYPPIWSCSAVLLITLEAYSVYLPSLSIYTYKHQAIVYPPFGAAVLYFWLHWRPTACTYPASQCTHTNMRHNSGFVHTSQRYRWRKAFILLQEM